MNKELEQVINEGIEEVLAHESFQAANGALALQYLRSGNRHGYQGEIIQVALRKFADKIIAATKTVSCPHFITPNRQAACTICQSQ